MLARIRELFDKDPYRLMVLLLGREDADKLREIEERAPPRSSSTSSPVARLGTLG
ncbi:MAG: hypothetical protein ABWW69_07055 [Pyrodictiaceae archaeon]